MSGTSWGPISERWAAHAKELDEIANRTSLPGLKAWARDGAEHFRVMAAEERKREADEAIERP